ncbi:MAG: AIR synthase-related protein, partial [Candidatus Binatia bacterium]
AGHLTGGCKRNRAYLEGKISIAEGVGAPLREAAYDPQTSGGLLIALPAAEAASLLADLHRHGLQHATRIGSVAARGDHWVALG